MYLAHMVNDGKEWVNARTMEKIKQRKCQIVFLALCSEGIKQEI